MDDLTGDDGFCDLTRLAAALRAAVAGVLARADAAVAARHPEAAGPGPTVLHGTLAGRLEHAGSPGTGVGFHVELGGGGPGPGDAAPWTAVPPRETGWYWCRVGAARMAELCPGAGRGSGPWVAEVRVPRWPDGRPAGVGVYARGVGLVAVDDYAGHEWAGPLVPPG